MGAGTVISSPQISRSIPTPSSNSARVWQWRISISREDSPGPELDGFADRCAGLLVGPSADFSPGVLFDIFSSLCGRGVYVSGLRFIPKFFHAFAWKIWKAAILSLSGCFHEIESLPEFSIGFLE